MAPPNRSSGDADHSPAEAVSIRELLLPSDGGEQPGEELAQRGI